MRSFNMGRFGGGDDPWFRVGDIDVNTTMFIVGTGLLSMLVWAAEGPSRAVSKFLWLGSKEFGAATGGSAADGQLWRLITWPIANAPDFWTLLLFAVFFMLGSQLEGAMGRRLFTIYLITITVIPAVIVTLFELVTGTPGIVFGLRPLEVGVLVAFAVRYPTARFFFNIPAWLIAGLIVVIDFLQAVGNRDSHSLIVLFSIVGLSLVMIRSMGFAEESQWIPKLPLPANLGGDPKAVRASSSRRKKRGRANLSVAPPPAIGPPRRELSKLEEAEMDSILDQVSEHGMDSLTPQQRKRLEDHSKRLRKRD